MSKNRNNRVLTYDRVISQQVERLKKGQKPMIGIDIGSSSIKMVQMKKNSRIARFAMETLPDGIMNQGRIEVASQLADIIKRTASKNKIKGSHCSLCISGNEMIVRELKLPEMNEEQIMDNIKHEITSFLPLSHDEYCIDYKILEYIPSQDETPGKLRIMVAAVPNSIVTTYINTLKKANLKVSYIDVVPNIAGKLAKWIIMNNNLEDKIHNIGIVDFGSRSTNIILLKDGYYFIHKTISNGGDYLTAQIAEKLNMDYLEAEEFKKKVNFFDNSTNDNASQYVKNYIDYLLNDIERTVEFFKNRNNQDGIDRIYIMGGGSMLKGLAKYMKDHLYIEIAPLCDSLIQIKKGNDYINKLSVFSQAIGATMREE